MIAFLQRCLYVTVHGEMIQNEKLERKSSFD